MRVTDEAPRLAALIDMKKPDEQLVQLIADQVVAALASRPGASDAPSGGALIHPPAGVCTGDYSKFVELSRVGAKTQASREISRAIPALGGIITAEQLQRAIDASPDGVADLAPDARLTPLASDLAREHPQKVRRGHSDPSAIRHPPSAMAPPWLWWADSHSPAMQELAGRWRGRVEPITAPRTAAGLMQVVRDLAQRVRDGRAQGGLLFVQSAATAACYVNRCRSLRGIVGTSAAAVEQGIAELGANVLIVEYATLGGPTLAELVRRMLEQPPTLSPQAQRELRGLEECA